MAKLFCLLVIPFLLSLTFGQKPEVVGSLDDLLNKISEDELAKRINEYFPPPPPPDVKEENPCTEGECVPYYLCKNGTIITDGFGILDVRFGSENNPDKKLHPCKKEFDTCCLAKSDKPIIPDEPLPVGCGYRNEHGVASIKIKGDVNNEAQYGEFPWAIILSFKNPNNSLTFFAGSLIHNQVVLTAAHYVHDRAAEQISIRAGEWNTNIDDEPLPTQDRRIKEIIIHEHFNPRNVHNDIALLILDSPVHTAPNVNTICLPPPHTSLEHKRCIATGWGKKIYDKAAPYQTILKKVQLPIVPSDTCQAILRTSRLGPHFILDKSFICAGGEKGIDTCTGDGGAPLACPIEEGKSRYYQGAIVSWGIGCGGEKPSVNTNVPLFREWIDEQFKAKKLDSSSYTA